MDEKQLSDLIDQKIKEWEAQQQVQTNGYEYKRSFNAMMQCIGRDILQKSVGDTAGVVHRSVNFHS